MSRRYLPLFCFLILSCAAVGTRSSIYDEESLFKIKKILVIAPRDSDPLFLHYSQLMLEILKRKISESALFVIIPTDTLKTYLTETDTSFNAVLDVAKKLQVDAVFQTHFDVDIRRFEHGAIVSIGIIDVKHNVLVMETSHNTFLGNSYFMPPTMEQATEDACQGALAPILQKWQNKER